MKIVALLNLAVTCCWLVFVCVVIYDIHDHRQTMEAYGRRCAETFGVPYTGKTCVQLRDEAYP